ncbi:uncharacterized protein TRAVEDRAFT_49712 [Trametes versicolor FP-101664 SS1]|uniref:uncharacterized protein n=1 Tax=Trametes versicolor (strain FP-101664) TaxID=717944 RepID=UPI00046220DA|nr:uncharacterized protein TRAVEDRAFT_49712 [Trametes versicolor FP-101664 SS1]EIW56900.1 hypothetical protein TRAVEDRAFT_49712 [Trametes versicolor FP-101664 SS1]
MVDDCIMTHVFHAPVHGIIPGRLDAPAFENARPASRLVNAYVSVHLSHATFDDAINLYCMLFAQLVLQKDAVPSYVEALERCTRDRGEPERRQALQFTREVWEETLPLELAWRRGLEHPEGNLASIR